MPDNNVNDVIEREIYFSTMYKDLGITNYAKAQCQKALNLLQEALEHFYILSGALKDSGDSELISNTLSEIQTTKDIIVQILTEYGDSEYEKKDFGKALEFYKNILYYKLSDIKILTKIANCLEREGAYVSAVAFAKKALDLNSENPSLYSFIAYIYGYKLEDYGQSISYFKKYIEKNPSDAYAYNSLGHIIGKLYKCEKLDEQIKLFEHALELSPNLVGAIRNLAIIYPRVGKFEESINCYKRLFKMENLADDYFSYACLQIKLGNFEEGWKYFGTRFNKKFEPTLYPKIDKPLWNGEKIEGKTLLVNFEQGFGDTIQFFRYIPLLKEYAGKAILRVQDALVELLAANTDAEVVGESVGVDDLTFDYHVPMMSLPAIFKMNKENIPFPEGYLKADIEKVKIFKNEVFHDDNCIKIGISWHGAAVGNKRRDITLESFKPLLEKENCKIYSFQKDADAKELSDISPKIYNLGGAFKNFSDTAAALENIDLLVTSDNSIVHVAGAIGKKTILLLNEDSEWRWFFDDKDTPWYKSVKIIKKSKESESWQSLIEKAAKEVK